MGTPPTTSEDPTKTFPEQWQAAEVAERVKRADFEHVAKLVRRPVVEYIDRKDAKGESTKVPRTKLVAVKADEVLSFKDYGTHVVVVTKDGQKFSSADDE